MTPSSSTPQKHQSSDGDLSGKILQARVVKTFLDNCELALIDPESGQEYNTHGRLYQHDSLAWKSEKLLRDLPDYRTTPAGERPTPLTVYVTHQRAVGTEHLWFVHERWGHNDPWVDLALQEGDLVYGVVSREIVQRQNQTIVGYLVQLDESGALCDLDGERRNGGTKQPDIEVFIPTDELPWADGSLGERPNKKEMQRMTLAKGEKIQALLLEIRLPPLNPLASITRLIHHRDAHGKQLQSQREAAALVRFWLLWGKRKEEAMKESAPPPHPPLHGLRLLLVDDDEQVLRSYTRLYQLNGAEVHCVWVERNRFAEACDALLAELSGDHSFDLVMIDYSLPGPSLGERLIEQVVPRLTSASQEIPPLLLLTAHLEAAYTTPAKRQHLSAMGVIGFLQRPLRHAELQQLLGGKQVWAERPPPVVDHAEETPARESGNPVHVLLDQIIDHDEVRFALLLRITPEVESSLYLGAGALPFQRNELNRVLSSTALHLLAENRITYLTLNEDEAGNLELRPATGHPAHWEAFEVRGERWILGVGFARTWAFKPYWIWWREALAGRLEARSWSAWAHQSSSFVALGMAHQGLCHEIFNLRNKTDILLQIGESWVQQYSKGDHQKNSDITPIVAILGDLRDVHQETLALAEHLLEGLTDRDSHLFLPSALNTVRSIVSAECKANNLLLEMGPVPAIALPIPSAALVLPLANLLLNATKHHYRQENRIVSLTVDVKRSANEDALLHIDVRDNGPGLSLAAQAQLWQAGHSFAPNERLRHGMGLWLSRRLAEDAGGTLDCIESWRYLGTHFRLSFPIEL